MRFRISSLKYAVSHVLIKAKTMISKKNLSVRHFGYVSNLVLMVALCLGLYTRWTNKEDMTILVIAFLGLFVFAISSALIYYFSMEEIGFSLSRLWIGCLLGIVSFGDQGHVKYGAMEEVMNILLMSSIAIRCFWNVLERLMNLTPNDIPLVNKLEMLEMIGMMIALLICDNQFGAISLLIVALSLTLTSIRLKSYLGVLNLFCIIIMASLLYFPRVLRVHVNPFGLIVFVVRVAFEPVLDLYFNGLTLLERWEPFLSKSTFTRRLAILFVLLVQVCSNSTTSTKKVHFSQCLLLAAILSPEQNTLFCCVSRSQLTFYGFMAKQMPHHKEWYIVVPIFAAFSFVWWSYHLVFIISAWQFMNKVSLRLVQVPICSV